MKKFLIASLLITTQAMASVIYTISDGINTLHSPDKDYPVFGPVRFIKEHNEASNGTITREYDERSRLIHKYSAEKYLVEDHKYTWNGNLVVEWINGYGYNDSTSMTVDKYQFVYDEKKCLTSIYSDSQQLKRKKKESVKCTETSDGYVKAWGRFTVHYNKRGWLTRIVDKDDSIISASGVRQGLTETLYEYDEDPQELPGTVHVRVASVIDGRKSYYGNFYVDEQRKDVAYWLRGDWIKVSYKNFDMHGNWLNAEHISTSTKEVIKRITREIRYSD